jgi:hypothetical protein
MRRREFITLLGGAAVAWPLTAGAQQSPIRALIGMLSPLSAQAASPLIAAFRSALRDLGYVEGRDDGARSSIDWVYSCPRALRKRQLHLPSGQQRDVSRPDNAVAFILA